MSRQELHKNEYGIAWGEDRCFGCFIQVWRRERDNSVKYLVDIDGMEREEMATRLQSIKEDYGFI